MVCGYGIPTPIPTTRDLDSFLSNALHKHRDQKMRRSRVVDLLSEVPCPNHEQTISRTWIALCSTPLVLARRSSLVNTL